MKLAIYGAGGHGRVVLNILKEGGHHEPVVWLDSNKELEGTTRLGLKVRCDVHAPFAAGIRHAIVAVGDNRSRMHIATTLRNAGYTLINAIHPRSWVSSDIESIGENVVICAGAHVCTGCRIGDSVILNTASVVDHECVLNGGVHVCPGSRLAGRVHVGAGAFLGLGSSIIQNIDIGPFATVGAGAVVTRPVPPETTVIGVPARPVT